MLSFTGPGSRSLKYSIWLNLPLGAKTKRRNTMVVTDKFTHTTARGDLPARETSTIFRVGSHTETPVPFCFADANSAQFTELPPERDYGDNSSPRYQQGSLPRSACRPATVR